LAVPKRGATGLGYELARQFGLKVIEPRPALVPLVLGGGETGWTKLAGVAAEVEAWVESDSKKHSSGAKAPLDLDESDVRAKAVTYQLVPFREKMLVTHRGLSGPAVLQASSYWRLGDALVVDVLAARAGLFEELRQPGARRDLAAVKQALRTVLPHRVADYMAEIGGPRGWSNGALEACERELRRWKFHPVGTEGFEKAEVTAGGVDTDELQARTMEARAVPGLYFIGEVVDVTGQLGGFNFEWAWASGVAAGKAC